MFCLLLCDVTKEFGIPSAVGSTITWYLDMEAAASVIIGILSGFLTGGLGLIANAGRQALTVYLKEELRKRGKKVLLLGKVKLF
ncbi:uberolysin/carnocyclin family circular bacteriocin [Bacillus safensis]|uniref:uberolysin/carnocyclin family circular bacteriocin n=1 Tax=Bacillus safensis TaxID=561879 RepID=UPI00374487BD